MTRPYRSPSVLEYSFLISLVAQVQLNGRRRSESEETETSVWNTPTNIHVQRYAEYMLYEEMQKVPRVMGKPSYSIKAVSVPTH